MPSTPSSADAAAKTTNTPTSRALLAIRSMDYVIIFARDLPAMRRFYETVMQFQIYCVKFPQWIEYRVGATLLVLTQKGVLFDELDLPMGCAALQLAFRVTPAEVSACAADLVAQGVVIERVVEDQPWGHRTLFFRDPDGNIIEIYADL